MPHLIRTGMNLMRPSNGMPTAAARCPVRLQARLTAPQAVTRHAGQNTIRASKGEPKGKIIFP
jgi:hypothetical protein